MIFLNIDQLILDSISIEGIPTRYGQAERWKLTAERIGCTKPSRAPEAAAKRRQKNDGRPPDTSKELLKSPRASPMKSKTVKPKSIKPKTVKFATPVIDKPIGMPSYKWKASSCWLDTSLEILYITVSRNFDDFTRFMPSLGPESGQ